MIYYDADAYMNKLHRLLVSLVASLRIILVLAALFIMTYGFYVFVKFITANLIVGQLKNNL